MMLLEATERRRACETIGAGISQTVEFAAFSIARLGADPISTSSERAAPTVALPEIFG
jgi:hypothetical protein